MLPKQWPLVSYEEREPQFEVVQKILDSPRISRLVCATDAGREGELIRRYIYDTAQCQKPVSRLLRSPRLPEAIARVSKAAETEVAITIHWPLPLLRTQYVDRLWG